MTAHDTQAIHDALALLTEPGQILELRVPSVGGRSNNTASGYFDDLEKAAQAAARYNGRDTVYMTLHKVDPALFARAANRMKEYAKATTADANILARHWLLIDADATRPADISSTDEEHELALARTQLIRDFLRQRGWPEPIYADSGNGGHLLYRVDLPADDGELTKRILKVLAAQFNDDNVKIDETVYNPSRISKVYGTFACKGDNIPDRPHRLARILEAPDVLTVVPVALLEALAGGAPNKEPPTTNDQPQPAKRRVDVFDVEDYLRKHGVAFSDPVSYRDGKKWMLDACVWSGHTDRSAVVWQTADGIIHANCNHNSCEGKGWIDLREHFEPGYRAQKEENERAFQARQRQENHTVNPEIGEIVAARRLTDYGNAERLVDLHGEDLRFCHPFGKWLSWDRTRWQIDSTAEVMRRAKLTARHIYQEAADAADPATAKELAKHAIRSESDARLRAMISLAESEPGVPVMPDQLDADPWLFNVESGTVDLKNDNLRAHDRADRITKRANVAHDPTATCPTFEVFLAKVLPSLPLRQFVQRAIGYSLTGDTREDVIFIAFGPGSNGKTTFMQTMQALMGDYAMQTPTETLMVKRGEGIPNDVARLKGARLVAAAEAEQGKRLAESLIKQLTGGDRISARFLHAEWFDFDPTFKIWLSTNHKPVIRGTDLGIWRRIRLIPFTVTIPQQERDEALAEKLLAELPGILNWALAGCRDWLQHGLGLPQEVQEATKSYREEMDILGTWLGDCCVEGINHQAAAAELYASYKRWCEGNGAHPMPQYALGSRLSERGFEAKRGHGGKRYWRGIGLLAPDGAPPPEQPDFASGDTGDTGDGDSGISAREKNTIEMSRKPRHPVSPASPDTDALGLDAEDDLPDRVALRKWADDEALGWENRTFPEAAIREATRRYYALTFPSAVPRDEMAKVILAAMKGGR